MVECHCLWVCQHVVVVEVVQQVQCCDVGGVLVLLLVLVVACLVDLWVAVALVGARTGLC